MTPELTALTLALLLHCALMIYMGTRAGELGDWAAGPRDTPPPKQPSTLTGRLSRTVNNSFESLVMFAPAVLIVTFTDQTSAVTTIAAVTHLLARLLYIPAYLFGWTPWRSLIWLAGFFATAVMLIATLI
ncbi:MAPEG family protein [Salipiger sp. P9]|uniref:MAPEG family protein n=1 Tax=Salipiger pentaromativorans TaxID=2943193 RepID=UPI002157B9D8|nr:MAPEG family protein [Salipiger pentaromativorans]MCR8548060.1 MAPEG family protein [Salipiger pentaromativorans]